MKKIKTLFLFLTLLISEGVYSQEVLFPMTTNPVLMRQSRIKSPLRMMPPPVDDTIPLPFRDDFSRPGVYPDETLWLDSGVYINNNYTDFPVTIGIATFDGLNHLGCPYHPGSNQDSIADVLTSHCIDFGLPSTDTTIWFSFFYQPQGLGDEPETQDSLILQFKDTAGDWTTVWSLEGKEDSAFQRVNIRLIDKYIFKGFQFRFYNIATVNGNRDHWNLDYVLLDKNRFENDGIEDYSLIRPQGSLLTEFTSMPYTHYKALGSPPTAGTLHTDMDDSIYVINYGPTALTPYIDIFQVGQPVPDYHVSTPGVLTGNPLSYVAYTLPANYYFPALPADSADYLIKSYIDDPVVRLNKYNDTSYYYQHFHNYYSYDDGSTEVSYGVTGNVDVSIAYLFNVKVTDTLRGVQIYFNPTGEDVSNKLFQLTVWSEINLTNQQSIELYRMINQKPGECDSLNGFKTYLFDTTLVVGPGNIWVGLIQNEPRELYGIGFDRNIDSRSKMYYRVDGIWSGSSVTAGSWMIRPLFGKRITLVSVEENEHLVSEFTIYPNPANDHVRIQFDNPMEKKYTYQIFDCIGSLVQQDELPSNRDINISGLSKGIYIIRLSTPGDRAGKVQKLIVH